MEPQRSRQPNPGPTMLLVVLAFISLYGAGKYMRGLFVGFPDRFGGAGPTAASAPSKPAPSSAPVTQVVTHATQSAPRRASHDEEAWSRFSARFGEELNAERTADGRIAAIRGTPGSGRKASGNYRPEDSEAAVARAREILEAASGLLGLERKLPLGEPTVRTGSVSAQVVFPETWEGIRLEPAGTVSVDLGPQGEILNLNSNYVHGVQPSNERRLDPAQAQAKAEAVVHEPGSPFETLGGNPVIWVSNSGPGGAPVGRHAYDYTVAGHQVVIDADNGEVLFRRDRRVF